MASRLHDEQKQTRPKLEFRRISSDHHHEIEMLDAFQRTILYALTNTQIGMAGVSGLTIHNSTMTAPVGCIIRFVGFISNPGSSVCQVELRICHDNYMFWVHSAKHGEQTYSNEKYDIDHLIYLIFRILEKWSDKIFKHLWRIK